MFPKFRKIMYNGFVEVLMRTEVESLTPAETAVVSGVSVRDVHRIIDEQILPDSFYNVTQTRSFKSQACVYISFYFRAADRFTAEERQRTIARASKTPDAKAVRDDFLTVDFALFRKGVDERLQRLHAARQVVVSDPEILNGTPVIRGTRVPAYHVAATLAVGTSMEKVLSAYPSINREQAELAALYAEANPQRGRPRQPTPLPAGAKVLVRRRGHLSKPA
jgi:uncharacterized protein (DUF433 family)